MADDGEGSALGEAPELIIRSEAQAFEVLEAALNKELGQLPFAVKFEGWPILEIKLEGAGYDSTITSDIAAGLVELQQAINRTYARAVHHSTNARALTAAERREIQFKAKVRSGSSLIEVNLGDVAEKVGMELVGKMDPSHIAVIVLGIALVSGSVVAYKAYLRHRSEDKKISEESARQIALSKEETQRLTVMANAMRAEPLLANAREDFDDARHEIVRGTGDAKTITVDGVTIDRLSAHAIASAKRSQAKAVQLNGDYFIKRVDWQQDGEIRILVQNSDTHRTFLASLRDDSLDGAQASVIQNAEWARKKVYLSINATELRGEVTKATIVGVHVQPDGNAPLTVTD